MTFCGRFVAVITGVSLENGLEVLLGQIQYTESSYHIKIQNELFLSKRLHNLTLFITPIFKSGLGHLHFFNGCCSDY